MFSGPLAVWSVNEFNDVYVFSQDHILGGRVVTFRRPIPEKWGNINDPFEIFGRQEKENSRLPPSGDGQHWLKRAVIAETSECSGILFFIQSEKRKEYLAGRADWYNHEKLPYEKIQRCQTPMAIFDKQIYERTAIADEWRHSYCRCLWFFFCFYLKVVLYCAFCREICCLNCDL